MFGIEPAVEFGVQGPAGQLVGEVGEVLSKLLWGHGALRSVANWCAQALAKIAVMNYCACLNDKSAL
jgi:hypothetical protein